MQIKLEHWPRIVALLLALAWLAIWGAWVPHQAASLNQNVLDFAEWTTFLNDVRFGELNSKPDLLRLSVALAVITLAVSMGFFVNRLARWIVRLIALFTGVIMLPPYPGGFSLEAFQIWLQPSYRWQFTVALLLFAGIALSFAIDLLSEQIRLIIIAALSVLATGIGIYAFTHLLGPFHTHYARTLAPGWGALLFFSALILTVVSSLFTVFRLRRTSAIAQSV